MPNCRVAVRRVVLTSYRRRWFEMREVTSQQHEVGFLVFLGELGVLGGSHFI